jgi:hypothetical protein
MLLAELKIKIRGEFDKWEENEYNIETAFAKLETYARQLFSEEWADGLKLETED